jgi:hypothetical protein
LLAHEGFFNAATRYESHARERKDVIIGSVKDLLPAHKAHQTGCAHQNTKIQISISPLGFYVEATGFWPQGICDVALAIEAELTQS